MERKKKIPIKLDDRGVNFKEFFTVYRDEIDKKKRKNKRKKKRSHTPRNPYKGLKTIGLGIESQIKERKIKASDVKIDANTDPKKAKREKHILYASGWSLKDEEY